MKIYLKSFNKVLYLNTKDMIKRQEDDTKCIKKALIREIKETERENRPLRREIHKPNMHAMRDHLLLFESAHLTAAAPQKQQQKPSGWRAAPDHRDHCTQ